MQTASELKQLHTRLEKLAQEVATLEELAHDAVAEIEAIAARLLVASLTVEQMDDAPSPGR